MKRILVNVILIALLVLTIVWCVTTGKSHNIILENTPVIVDGIEYQPLEAIYVSLGQKSELMLEGDVIIMRAIGNSIKLKIDTVDDDDNILETRGVSLPLKDLGNDLRMSIPVFYAKAANNK